MTDDLQRITADEQMEAHRREARKVAVALAGDVGAYYTALRGIVSPALLVSMTHDFNRAWLRCHLEDDMALDLSMMYAEADDDV